MAFPNVSDIVATTIENRSKKIADNVTKNNAFLTWMEARGNTRTISGGSVILEELSFAENPNAGWYSGYDLLPVGIGDVITAAQYDLKQAACPVVISGLEQLQNSGEPAMINLLDSRLNVAEATMANLISAAVYSDGSAAGGKQLQGLNAAVPVSTGAAAGIYGGISRVTWPFWRPLSTKADYSVVTGTDKLTPALNALWASLVRGNDRPDLILSDSLMWGYYMATLQSQQRFTDTQRASRGFTSIKFFDCDWVLDGGIGGFCPPKTLFMLNTKYFFWRPHADRNMVPLAPNKRYAINQDAEVQILAWAGNITSSGQMFQGRLESTV